MLTEFGKVLRHIRLDRNELLKDMAEKLEVSASYLSAVEHGKRDIPSNWINFISSAYCLDRNESIMIQEAADKSKSAITLDLRGVNSNANTLANAFARRFEGLDQKDIDKMMDILNKERR